MFFDAFIFYFMFCIVLLFFTCLHLFSTIFYNTPQYSTIFYIDDYLGSAFDMEDFGTDLTVAFRQRQSPTERNYAKTTGLTGSTGTSISSSPFVSPFSPVNTSSTGSMSLAPPSSAKHGEETESQRDTVQQTTEE